uniref:Uncharacterized protein n=1 Tax=Rhodosorus marinus TaxID=101924 RepID=A0A7S2ZP82_9RHOD|mmetsp:Transcript_2726/g.12153  ORF Transcript_2726/g.12153 Transcript_2726/m.12153 type:complete len:735 (+) Transcript_2726:484-2688(+)
MPSRSSNHDFAFAPPAPSYGSGGSGVCAEVDSHRNRNRSSFFHSHLTRRPRGRILSEPSGEWQRQILPNVDGRSSSRRSADACIVYLRIGDLRLHDNPAFSASTRYEHCIPICVLDAADRDFWGALSCATYLRDALRARGSNLWIAISSSPGSVLRQYAMLVPSVTILMNQHSNNEKLHLNTGCREVRLPPMPATLPSADAAKRLPPPPPEMAHCFLSAQQPTYHGSLCERKSLLRLKKILLSASTPYEHAAIAQGELGVAAFFKEDLRVGCLSTQRLRWEMRNSRVSRASNRRFSKHHISSTRIGAVPSPLLASVGVATVAAYDLNGSKRRSLEWDDDSGQLFLTSTNSPEEELAQWLKHKYEQLRRLFLPDDVSPDYYHFTAIRFVQRIISATVNVLGTQSLILALGLKSGANNQAAAIAWVLKNGFGRVGKMLWAGTKGKDFDVDPKRWRFNSALVYSLGNAMEILTQVFPSSFLFFATMAITFKQVSWLTATATRNAMYRSFGRKRDNIGDITAKGEAQIVIAELIGMGLGIGLSKVIGTKMRSIVTAFTVLSLLDIAAIHQELRVVVFRNLNPQRTGLIVDEYTSKGTMPTPHTISRRERIMLRPLIGEDGVTFTGLLEIVTTKDEWRRYMEIFRKEKFLIGCKSKKGKPCPGKQCKIVIHEDARSRDILRSMLTLGYLRQEKAVTFETISEAKGKADQEIRPFLDAAKSAGWNTEQLLYSTLKRRCSW